jgi:ABC-type Fe3+-hydroxamate transport system substrate-binding protein
MLLQQVSPCATAPTRIISLVPSITELLHYLGLHNEVIGITKFCIHPPEWYMTKTRIGGTKNINLKKILELQPQLVFANKEENVQEQIEEISRHCDVWITNVDTIKSAYQMLNDVGVLTNTLQQVIDLISKVKEGFNKITISTPIKTAYLIWRKPYMTVGADTYIHAVMQTCGMQNAFASQQRYPKVTIENLQDSGCKLILLSTEPYPFKEKHIAELQQQLPGVKIALVNGEMFSWYGSRMLQTPLYLQGLLSTLKTV